MPDWGKKVGSERAPSTGARSKGRVLKGRVRLVRGEMLILQPDPGAPWLARTSVREWLAAEGLDGFIPVPAAACKPAKPS